jgi:hypothetical protein
MTIQTWTYSGDPNSSDLDKVRFLIGDTDPEDRLLSDEEILFLLHDRGSFYSAASIACLTIAARYAREVNRQVGDLRIDAEQRQKHYQQLHEHFASQAGEPSGMSPFVLSAPYAGGISRSDREEQIEDTDRVQPAFSVGRMDFYPRDSMLSSTSVR